MYLNTISKGVRMNIDDLHCVLKTILSSGASIGNKIDCGLYKEYVFYSCFGLLDNDEFTNALGPVAYHGNKNIGINHKVQSMVDSYSRLNLNELFGISLIEFMELDSKSISMLIDQAGFINQNKSRAMDDIANKLKGNYE